MVSAPLNPSSRLMTLKSADPVAWAVSPGYIDYDAAVEAMEKRAAQIRSGAAREMIWLLEHRPLYTAGTSANPADLRSPDMFPVYKTSRGGQFTYHGPGQRVAYVLLDLEKRGKDVRCFVHGLEEWLIRALSEFGLKGERRAGRVGVWIDRTRPGGRYQEDKIAAIGVRVRRWVSFHGVSFNVEPDLSHFAGITPCGVDEDGLGVTSLSDLGLTATMDDVDTALLNAFEAVFGPTELATVRPLES